VSFGFVPLGLRRVFPTGGFAFVSRPGEDWDGAGGFFECAATGDPEGGAILCKEMGGATESVSVDIAALIATAPDADYYAVLVGFLGPRGFDEAHVGCRLVFPWGCGPGDPVTSDTTVNGTYLSLEGVSVASGGHTENDAPFELGSESAAGGGGQLLVNPAPVWPVPDAQGNTFGQCLFTPAQVPASITATVDVANHHAFGPPTTTPAGINAQIWAYYVVEDPFGATRIVDVL
jgi:hypothetical protein